MSEGGRSIFLRIIHGVFVCDSRLHFYVSQFHDGFFIGNQRVLTSVAIKYEQLLENCCVQGVNRFYQIKYRAALPFLVDSQNLDAPNKNTAPVEIFRFALENRKLLET